MDYFFIKLLLLLALVCMIALILIKIKEQFTADQNPYYKPPPVKLSVETNKHKNKLILTWNKSNKNIHHYFIIMYRNNQGPFIITFPNDFVNPNEPSEKFKYEHNEVSMNVEYKFAVLALVTNSRMDGSVTRRDRIFSDIEKYVKVKLTPPGLEIDYVKDYSSKITCNADGTFTLKNTKHCSNNNNIVQAKSMDDTGTMVDFEYDAHAMMMRDLNYSPKIILDF
jgi:hypothetical protein